MRYEGRAQQLITVEWPASPMHDVLADMVLLALIRLVTLRPSPEPHVPSASHPIPSPLHVDVLTSMYMYCTCAVVV